MKSLINRIAIAFVVASLMSIAAFAKERKESFTIDSTMKVNGTVLKKGSYDVRVAEDKGELEILRNGKVVARANVSTEKRSTKASRFELRSTGTGEERTLAGVAFSGSDYNLVLRDSQASN